MLSNYKAIYLPTIGDDRPLSNRDDLLDWLLVEMALAYGGAIATQEGRGSWTTPAGVVVVEPITIVKSFCAPDLGNDWLHALARELKARAWQEAVAIETPQGMEFVS
jgi:hypothetical protein